MLDRRNLGNGSGMAVVQCRMLSRMMGSRVVAVLSGTVYRPIHEALTRFSAYRGLQLYTRTPSAAAELPTRYFFVLQEIIHQL